MKESSLSQFSLLNDFYTYKKKDFFFSEKSRIIPVTPGMIPVKEIVFS
jgi:hypothetical protein